MTEFVWLDTPTFALVARITRQKAHRAASRALDGHAWRGHRLVVRAVHGKGGRAGMRYEVRLDSLPEELQLAWRADLPAVVQSAPTPDISDKSKTVASHRYELIRPTLRHATGSPERVAAVREIAAMAGKSDRTARGWIKSYEADGLRGLIDTGRADKGKSRTLISQCWDKAMRSAGVADDMQHEISARMGRYTRSLWAELHAEAGGREIQRYASVELLRLTVQVMPAPMAGNLKAVCQVPRPFIEKFRTFRTVSIRDKDARRYFDDFTPRIMRSTAGMLPMQCVFGDGTPVDIWYRRADGSLATPKGIFWMDAATERLRGKILFTQKGQGVRGPDTAATFVEMARDPGWGAPGSLYLDNGKEYGWADFVKDAMALSMPIHWTDKGEYTPTAKSAVTRAQPHNGPAKGMIEGVFGIIEKKYLSMIPGWRGPGWAHTKIANVGKPPPVFPGTEEKLEAAIQQAIAIYNDTPRDGRLGGLSPNEKFRQLVEAGWTATMFGDGALEGVFCKTVSKRLRQCGIKHDNTFYYHDALTNPHLGEWIEARVPVFGDGQRIAVHDKNGKFVCVASPDTKFDHDDTAGAVESSRRKKLARQNVRAMKAQTDPLDTMRMLAEEAGRIEAQPTPEPGGVIRLDAQTETSGKQLAKSRRQLKQEQKTENQRQLAEWDEAMALMKRATGGNR